jgi:uncharacterized membrane protein YeaQ/YmgE (transglycosylase-associated protein family)
VTQPAARGPRTRPTIGFIVGAIARLLMPGRDPLGVLGTIVLGVAGSFVGGFLRNLVQ